ncbi:ABC transporter permease [Pollutibacter soli]|uniref:ABC transporter permease n=1 Tax=Pollutibacter soli TaxID=3034157 RepID=UPI00301323AC
MFNNYFKIAWRNLLKNKAFSAINIIGLAIGLSCFVLIMLYVVDELSFDRFHAKADRIYRVNSEINFGGNEMKLAVTSDPMGATLKKDYPQVEQYTRLYQTGNKTIKKGDQYIIEYGIYHADSTFFDVFSFPAIQGDTKTALNEPNTVVITEKMARKYFNSPDAVGKTLEADKELYKVTAVIKDIPSNSHLKSEMIFSMDNVEYSFGNFLSHNFVTYIVLKEGTDPKAFEKNFSTIVQKYIFPQAQQFMQIGSMAEFEKAGNKLAYELMPLTKIHLYSDRIAEISPNGDFRYVVIFSVVALIILVLACINFMNLATARSANRAREVGIRKVLGTEKSSLISQFLTESVLMTVFAMIIAIGIAMLALPAFNDIAVKQLQINQLFQPWFLVFLLALPLIVGLLSGSYPAFYLSRFQPIKVLKSNAGQGAVKKSMVRNGLVVLQFALSVIFIICTMVVYRQLHFIQNKKVGFDKEQVLIVDGTYDLGTNTAAFKNEVQKLPGVLTGTFSSFLPVTSSSRTDYSFSKEAVMTPENGFNMQYWGVDTGYVGTMGMQIIKGRNFSADFKSDSAAIIINETVAKNLGYPNPIGQRIYQADTDDPSKTNALEIIGVVRNFNFSSLKENVGPLSFSLRKSIGSAAFKLRPGNPEAIVAKIEDIYKSMAPGHPFRYRFLDQAFSEMYRAEQRVGVIAMVFACLAILIACLGLFGLSAYMAEQRTKEIGIRKVLGASVGSVTKMLSIDFVRLVVIATVVAFPVAYWVMHVWLRDFSERTSISWWIFVVAFVAAVGIALLTVCFQAIKAALANPVKSLRSE